MSFEFVPPEHIRHLAEKFLKEEGASKEAKKAMLDRLLSFDEAEIKVLHEYLESREKGVIQRLIDTWPFFGQRAVLVYLVPVLAGSEPRPLLRKRLGTTQVDHWTDVPGPRGYTGTVGVNAARAEGNAILGEIWLDKKMKYEYRGEQKSVDRTETVPLRAYFGSKANTVPLVEAYAGPGDAKKAALALLDWLLATEVPRAKADLEKVMFPLVFNEQQIHRVAVTNGWGTPSGVEGHDVTDEVGMLRFLGKKKDRDLGHLNASVPKVHAQLNSGRNLARRYIIDYTHGDGYEERFQASFYFNAHSHVLFHSRTSRPAIDWLIEEIRAYLKV